MNSAVPPKKPRVAVIPQLARVDWLHYALIGGRIVCGLWLIAFLWYGWTAWGEYRAVSSAVAMDGAFAGAFVRLEGAFVVGAGSPTPGIASSSREAILLEGLAKDCGISSFLGAHLLMYKVPRRGGPFAGKIVNFERYLGSPFSVVPSGGKPVVVEGTATRLYGTSFRYQYDPPLLTANLDAGPNLELEVLNASSGCVFGQVKKTGGQDRIGVHPERGLVLAGIPSAELSRNLLLRFGLALLCVLSLSVAALRTRRYACLDLALERPAQFCVFEATGGSEMVGTIGIVISSFLSMMLISPPGEVAPDTILYLHGAIALVVAGLMMSASRVEFFFVANKADGMLYAVSRGILGSAVTKVMKLTEFKPRAALEDVMTKQGERTSYYLETPTPAGGTLQVSDSYRDSIGPAETLSEYERFEKTEMTQTPVDIRRLLE